MLVRGSHQRVYRVGHLACGIGAGAAGFNDAEARVENIRATFECAGGIDVDPTCIENFDILTGSKGTIMDLFDREQYMAYHGCEPPAGWREAVPEDMRTAFGGGVDVIFASPPCRGLTSLLEPSLAVTGRYQALNALTLRTVWLALEAFATTGELKIFLLENVPGLATKGRPLLDRIQALLNHYGFAWSEDTHDCGEIGGLAQHRKRFLLVARHRERVPPFLYRPRKQRMKTVGEVLGSLPLPGDPAAGPMHRIPELAWKTWKRLAFVEPGRDWRSLLDLRSDNGTLSDWGIAPIGGSASKVNDPKPDRSPHNQVLGVRDWNSATGVVAGASRPMNGAYAVADPRYEGRDRSSTFGVQRWNGRTGTVTGNTHPSNGAFSVADERLFDDGLPTYAIVPISQGAFVANVKPTGGRGGRGKYRVTGLDEQSGTVIGNSTTGEGAYALADPTVWPVLPVDGLPVDDQRLVTRIIARDGTWHRPYTAYELAALQSLTPTDHGTSKPFRLVGSETDQRLFIGNAVPRAAARGMAETILQTLLLADMGVTFELSSEEIWAKPLAVALTLDQEGPGSAYDIERRLGV